jgi:hypothetical protein
MDRAYEGNETRELVKSFGYNPVVPPNPRRVIPWDYDRALYKKRNEVERLFRRLKGFRRVATRYDKLDIMFTTFTYFALIVIAINSVNRPYSISGLKCSNGRPRKRRPRPRGVGEMTFRRQLRVERLKCKML